MAIPTERRPIAFWLTLVDRLLEGVPPEDYSTTVATLERVARNLGWTES